MDTGEKQWFHCFLFLLVVFFQGSIGAWGWESSLDHCLWEAVSEKDPSKCSISASLLSSSQTWRVLLHTQCTTPVSTLRWWLSGRVCICLCGWAFCIQKWLVGAVLGKPVHQEKESFINSLFLPWTECWGTVHLGICGILAVPLLHSSRWQKCRLHTVSTGRACEGWIRWPFLLCVLWPD